MVAADEFVFDIEQYERRTWEVGGHLEGTAEYLRANRKSAVYQLNFPDENKKAFERYQGNLEVSGLYRSEPFSLHSLLNVRYRDDIFETRSDIQFFQLYATGEPTLRTNVEVGKRALRWGTGYAFNPTAFLERPKDPVDPDLSREGFIIAGTEYIRSFSGPIQAFSLSGTILPVTGDINDDFGPENDINLAVRSYLLYRDTDIYFMVRHGDSRPTAFGTAFSRNLADNFEIHGEFAWFDNREIRVAPDADNVPVTRKADPFDLLAGLRYLSVAETTWIIEYYRNGAGYTGSEIRRMATLARENKIFPGLDRGASRIGRPEFGAPQPMRDYLYVRAMHNEPFDRLYTRAGATLMINLQDGSASIIPEIAYTGFTNLELRGRIAILTGGRNTDFGERLNRWRTEIRARYFF